MISISITGEAYAAIKATLPDQHVSLPSRGPDGMIKIWLDRKFVDRLGKMRGPGESYSDVIVRMAKGDGGEE